MFYSLILELVVLFQLTNANLAEDSNDTKTAKIIQIMQLTETKSRAYRKYNSIKDGDRSDFFIQTTSTRKVPSS